MQENLTVARPYAQAAFDTAAEAGAVPVWDTALARLAAMVSDADMRRIIVDPSVGESRLLGLIFSVLGEVPPLFANFVKVLASAGRLPVVPEISQAFSRHRAAAENIADVEVVSAFPLDGDLEQRIAAAMRTRLQKEIRITQHVDPGLIGGARVKVGDMVFDASLRGGLTQLSNVFNLK